MFYQRNAYIRFSPFQVQIRMTKPAPTFNYNSRIWIVAKARRRSTHISHVPQIPTTSSSYSTPSLMSSLKITWKIVAYFKKTSATATINDSIKQNKRSMHCDESINSLQHNLIFFFERNQYLLFAVYIISWLFAYEEK